MSPTIAAVFALVLVVPVLACLAAFTAAGVNPSFMTGVFTFAVVVGGVTAALFEIRRLIGP
jgi:hypothetical protein